MPAPPPPTLQCHFKLDVLDRDIRQDGVRAEVLGPSGPLHFDFDFSPSAGGGGAVFHPGEVGMHEVMVTNEGEPVRGAPHFLRSMPRSKKDYEGEEGRRTRHSMGREKQN